MMKKSKVVNWLRFSCFSIIALMVIYVIASITSLNRLPFPADSKLKKWMMLDSELMAGVRQSEIKNIQAVLVGKNTVVLSGKVRTANQKYRVEKCMRSVLSSYKLNYQITNNIKI